MAKRRKILTSLDRDFMAPDRMNFLMVLYTKKIPKLDLALLRFDSRGEATIKLQSGLDVRVRQNKDNRGKKIYHANHLVKSFNGQLISRAHLLPDGPRSCISKCY